MSPSSHEAEVTQLEDLQLEKNERKAELVFKNCYLCFENCYLCIFSGSSSAHTETWSLPLLICTTTAKTLKLLHKINHSMHWNHKDNIEEVICIPFSQNKDECLGIQPSRIMVITSLRHKGWARGNLDGHLICAWFVWSSYLQLSASQKDNLNHHYDGYSSRLLDGHTWYASDLSDFLTNGVKRGKGQP